MKTPSIEDPIRLGKSFWVTYVLLLGPSLWLLRPWSWELPIYAEIVGAFFPPFLAAVVLYTFVLFTISLTQNFAGQKRAFAWFAASIVGPSVFLVTAWIFSGYQNLPAICSFVAGFIAFSILCLSHRKKPNQSVQTTPLTRRF